LTILFHKDIYNHARNKKSTGHLSSLPIRKERGRFRELMRNFNKRRTMKTFITSILAILAISGLLIAGADINSANLNLQLLSCTIGLLVFGASLYTIAAINRED